MTQAKFKLEIETDNLEEVQELCSVLDKFRIENLEVEE